MPQPQTRRQRYEHLRSQLELERNSFLPHWRDLANFISPRRPRFNITDTNRGEARNRNILDATASAAARTLEGGMMAGMTSPARPWFKLTLDDPGLANFAPVKAWLHDVTETIAITFHRSGLYNVLPIIYGDALIFGTAGILQEEDFGAATRFSPLPIGSFMIWNNADGTVGGYFREYRMTVRQVVERFAEKGRDGKPTWDNISKHVRSLYDNGSTETWVDICHVIHKNEDHDTEKLQAKFSKPFKSVYYEKGTASESNMPYTNAADDVFLRESGYDFFPVMAPRWKVTGEDSYGTDCPGIMALPDIKTLQLGEKRLYEAIEKMIRPPMVAPPEMKHRPLSSVPGGVSYVATMDGRPAYQPAYQIAPKIEELEAKQEQKRQQIRKYFYEDLLLMLSNTDRRNITAREVDERHDEKVWAFGPVLEQFNKDLNRPLIDNTFTILAKQGRLPPPPEEIQGMDLKVEYISILAQAQKMISLSGIERFFGFVGEVSRVLPESLDKVDVDEAIDSYASITGIPPRLVRQTEAANEIREQRAQQQQQMQMGQDLAEAAKGAKNLAGAKLEDDNALKRLIDQSQAGEIIPTAA